MPRRHLKTRVKEEMNARPAPRLLEPPRRWSQKALGSLIFCAIVLTGAVPQASAEAMEPASGGWKGKTSQGLPIYFGVREGHLVTNVRLTYRDTICGKANIQKRDVSLPIDESGHFAGIVYPANGGVELQGTFTAPRHLKGKIVAGESSGLPGCTGGTISFTAGPKP